MNLTDSNDLKIMKAQSVNHRYMTELGSQPSDNNVKRKGGVQYGRKAMNGVMASTDDEDIFKQHNLQNMLSEEEALLEQVLARQVNGEELGSEYINTDDENEEEANVRSSGDPFMSKKGRLNANNINKDRKVVSSQDFKIDY
jgi:hypothetical protein